MIKKIHQELQQLLLKQKQEEHFHLPIEKEFIYYRRIAHGDLSILEEEMQGPGEGQGLLSNDPLRNMRYHLIILTAMITRFCIEEGLNSETAYTMSDMFIRKLDQAQTEQALLSTRYNILSQFIHIMNTEKKKHYSMLVTKATEYIENHLTENLSNAMIADSIPCSPDYLSHLFKKETGLTLYQYVLEQKCRTACYMLENGNHSCTEIGAFLGFSSASHFTSMFREIYGISPGAYRKQQARNTIRHFGL